MKLSDFHSITNITEIREFIDYVTSFYGVETFHTHNGQGNKPVYPMGASQKDIIQAIGDYLKALHYNTHNDRFTWGGGDSLDRERVRDFLVRNYGYSKIYDGGTLWILDKEVMA